MNQFYNHCHPENQQNEFLWAVFVKKYYHLIKFNGLCWEQNGNVTIVDTPGIGDDEELKKMLMEYIPKAVSFVIVIDVSRAGGLQKDRVWKCWPNYTVVPYFFMYHNFNIFVQI